MHAPRKAAARRLVAATLGLVALVVTACEPTPPTTTTPTSTTTTTLPVVATTKVSCATSGSITVATSIAPSVTRLLAAAKADGLSLCGGGFRSAEAQIAVRRTNCGPTYYDIWQKPSGQCSPPTAIPGTSMHEKGLAVDFSNCSTRTTACYVWLAANAATHGLKNLPSEPWHWSTNGH